MKTLLLPLTLAAALSAGVLAPGAVAAQPAAATKTAKGTGEITAIDAPAGTLTIKHQPIAALGWPAMTMDFRANPPSLLKGLKVGQKIGFDTRQGTGLPEVTAIRKP